MFPSVTSINSFEVGLPHPTQDEIERIEKRAQWDSYKIILAQFDADFKSELPPAVIQEKFASLPKELRERMKWGFWKLEGEPTGDRDFGQTFFSRNPYHPTVQKTIELILQNGYGVFPIE